MRERTIEKLLQPVSRVDCRQGESSPSSVELFPHAPALLPRRLAPAAVISVTGEVADTASLARDARLGTEGQGAWRRRGLLVPILAYFRGLACLRKQGEIKSLYVLLLIALSETASKVLTYTLDSQEHRHSSPEHSSSDFQEI